MGSESSLLIMRTASQVTTTIKGGCFLIKVFVFFKVAAVLAESSTSLEARALLDFRDSLTEKGALLRWSGNSPCLPPLWIGVYCEYGGHVRAINLQNFGIAGPMSDALARLENLTSVDLSGNLLSGTLPSSWASMPTLQALGLAKNRLTGTLPASWSNFQNLSTLTLSYNNLSGPLPDTWSNMTAMTTILSVNNSLTGTLPYSWGNLTSLKQLELSYNNMTGSIPDAWANMSRLETLLLSNNLLTGTLPSSWHILNGLSLLALYSNYISGSIPQSWDALSAMQQLYLHDNHLTGTLPSAWSAWDELTVLDLGQNNFTGTFPLSWSNMTKLKTLSLFNTQIEGNLSTAWQNMTSISELELSNNYLTGSVPESWASMTALSSLALINNSLTGSLPSSWGSLSQLTMLAMNGNNLTGPLPSAWSALGALRELDLSDNSLTGSLPMQWANLSNLVTLRLSDNQLTGPLLESWATLTKLQTFSLETNRFTGPLPAAWSNMTSVKYLRLQENLLTGSLPASWSSLLHAYLLNLNNNSLSGSLPEEWYFTGYAVVDLSNNELTGPIPSPLNGSNPTSYNGPLFILEPQKQGFGFCGPIPEAVKVAVGSATNWTGVSVLPQNGPHCAGGASGRPSKHLVGAIVGSVVGAIALALSVAALYLYVARKWRRRKLPGKSSLDYLPAALAMQKGTSIDSSGFQSTLDGGDVMFERTHAGELWLLGQGRFGKVYKGRYLKKLVAIKILTDNSEEEQAAFVRETLLLRDLRHPHVVQYLGHMQLDGKMMLILEYMQGGTLAAALAAERDSNSRNLGWKQKGLGIAIGVALGLHYLHTKKVIWFDCKSQNILLDQTKCVAKLSDVGISKVMLDTHTQAFMRGTPGYIAPELVPQLCGSMEEGVESLGGATLAVDIYSFGIVLWEIITGESAQKCNGHLREPRIPEECSADALQLYQLCLSRKAAQRPDIGKVLQRLQAEQSKLS